MASPQDNIYHAGSGVSVYGGYQSVAAWLASVPVGSYVSLPNSNFLASGVGWAGENPGGTGYLAIVTSWGSGVLNTVGVTYQGVFIPGTFLVIWGGGHHDYAGNELYAYGPLEANSPIWRRLTDPTIPAPTDVPRDANGYPVSRHTYDTLQYCPDTNEMIVMGCTGHFNIGSQFSSGNRFKFGVDPMAVMPWVNTDAGFPTLLGGNGATAATGDYNPLTKKAWLMAPGNGGNLWCYDMNTLSWSSYNKDNPNATSYNKGAIWPTTNLMIFATAAGSVYVQNLNTPNSAIYAPAVTGSLPNFVNVSMAWNEATSDFVTISSSGVLYRLKPGANPGPGGDPWVWSIGATTGTAPAAPVTAGTLGRLRSFAGSAKVPAGIVYMPTYNGPITFYRGAE
jgi:hypothetical protein